MSNIQIHHNMFRLRVMVILSGVFLMIGGMVMIFMDLKSEGSISIKTPFLTGSINATYIGLLVIFMGVVLVLSAIAITRRFTRNKVEVSRTLDGSNKQKTKATSTASDEELRKLFEQKFGFQLPDSANLSEPLLKKSLQEMTISHRAPLSQPVNRETLKIETESGARLSKTR